MAAEGRHIAAPRMLLEEQLLTGTHLVENPHQDNLVRLRNLQA